jgi:hypothetical protein
MAMIYPSWIKEKVTALRLILHNLEVARAVMRTTLFSIKLSCLYLPSLFLRVNSAITSKLDYLEQLLGLIPTG